VTERRCGRRELAWAFLAFVVLAAATALLYRPVLGFELMGDDYQWWQHAHLAMHRPVELLTDLDTFYRPASTWTLVLDRLAFGDVPAAFHATNLALHVLAGLLLVVAGRRLGLARPEASAVGLLWTLSPFTDEPAISVAIRFQDLLLISWLALVLAWPARGGRWTRGRLAAAVAATLLAAASKESWVVTPALAVALEAARGERRTVRWIRAAVPFAAAAALYTAVYFMAFPGGKGYFSSDPAVLAKVPHELAAFLNLEPFTPVAFPLTWQGLFAVAFVVGLAVGAWRRRLGAGVVGSAFLLFPALPTLFVPYLPTRYTAIPYAGFLMLVAAWAAFLRTDGAASATVRRAAPAAAAVLAGLVLVAGCLTVRADLVDFGRVSTAHRRLLEEAAAFLPAVPADRPALVVRLERENPLAAIARDPKGLPKLFYVRHADPYGLIDAAALFEWVAGREDLAWERVGPREVQGHPGDVILHGNGGFRCAEPAGDLAAAAERWRANGFPYRVIRPVALAPEARGRRQDPRRVPERG